MKVNSGSSGQSKSALKWGDRGAEKKSDESAGYSLSLGTSDVPYIENTCQGEKEDNRAHLISAEIGAEKGLKKRREG